MHPIVPTAGTADIIRECAAGIHRSDKNLDFWLEVQEGNHNVSLRLHKPPSTMVTQHSYATVALLHPHDATKTRELRLCTSSPQHATVKTS